MRRRLRPEEARLWSVVASTVRRARAELAAVGDDPPDGPPSQPPPELLAAPMRHAATHAPLAPLRATVESLAALVATGVGARTTPRPPSRHSPPDPGPIEPNRRRRIARAREPIGGRLDLHGHDQDRARAALHSFVLHAQGEGARAVLVITGKGRTGAGVLRARVPEWLAEAPARAVVAGVSPAEARHGGEGALYVALKRRS